MAKAVRPSTEAVDNEVAAISAKLTPDAYANLRSQLKEDVTDKLLARGTWILSFVVFVGGFLAFFGGREAIRQAVVAEVQKELATTKAQITASSEAAQLALNNAIAAENKAQDLGERVAAFSKKTEDAAIRAVAVIEAANAFAEEVSQQWSPELAKGFDPKTGAPTTIATGSSPAGLSEAERKATFIRQTPSDTGKRTDDGRKYIEIAFSLDIDPAIPAERRAQIFARVEKIDYVLDKRWFDPATRTISSPVDKFRYSVTVWGATQINGAVYLKDPPEILVFRGRMNLTSPSELRVETN